MPWSEWKSLSGNIQEENFNVTANVSTTITLSDTPKKLIIMQAPNSYGVSFPSSINIDTNTNPTEYYSYDYEGIEGHSISHEAHSKSITFKSVISGVVTVRYI